MNTNQKTCIWKNTDKFKETARVSEKYIGMSLEDQLKGIYTDLRQMSVGEWRTQWIPRTTAMFTVFL